jgi:hypothetical protein
MTTASIRATTDQRQARIAAIRAAALVREHLGQGTLHRPLPDRRHQITHRGRVFHGSTLEASVEAAGGSP